jgi:hypothetical protein
METRNSAGVQRKVYQSGHPPLGLQTSTPMVVAARAMATPAAIRPGDAVSPSDPRNSAAVGTISAAEESRMARCQPSQSGTETPPAGGVIPRPRLLIK